MVVVSLARHYCSRIGLVVVVGMIPQMADQQSYCIPSLVYRRSSRPLTIDGDDYVVTWTAKHSNESPLSYCCRYSHLGRASTPGAPFSSASTSSSGFGTKFSPAEKSMKLWLIKWLVVLG